MEGYFLKMKPEIQVKNILYNIFSKKHIEAALKHFRFGIKKYQEADWETSVLKMGKFVEAIVKSLYIYCGRTLPRSRKFKVGNIVRELEQVSSQYDDTIRLLIPRACVFIYDIASNRGARHDPDEINPNKMDATVVAPIASWIIAELIRFASAGSSTPKVTMNLVDGLIEKKFPYFEEIGNRLYINIEELSAQKTGLLLLFFRYPRRIVRKDLIDFIIRHGHSKKAAMMAASRLEKLVDDKNNSWKLRGIGRKKAAEILCKF